MSHGRGLADEVEAAAEDRDRALSAEDRRTRGVVHTPAALARFTLRRVDAALRAEGLQGVADPAVTLVDPACGPGVFLAAAHDESSAGAPGAVLGLDVDVDAVERAQRLLGAAFSERGWPLELRAGNTLSAPLELASDAVPVIVGNPPWAGRSANRDAAYTERLLEDFRRLPDGTPLRERKSGVLSDDYVRFIRWCAEPLRARPRGLLALLTNASYLDGPVHRAMRAALLSWFDRIDVVDLGGSALIARRRGEPDANLFGVRPGAALLLASRGEARGVRYVRVRGDAPAKRKALADQGPDGAALRPEPPLYRLVPSPAIDPRYAGWTSVAELFPFHREGVQTNRDALCYAPDAASLQRQLADFATGASAPGRSGQRSGHYDPDQARVVAADLAADPCPGVDVAYRPGLVRRGALTRGICHRPRPALLEAMERSELALLTVRKDRGERPWAHFGATRLPVDNCFLSSRSSCRTRAFPSHRPDGEPNLDLERARHLLREGPARSSADWLLYALAVCASRGYRRRFSSALLTDYPRLPPAPSADDFDAITVAGGRLAQAFSASMDHGPEVVIGHRVVRSRPLTEALDACTEACARLRI